MWFTYHSTGYRTGDPDLSGQGRQWLSTHFCFKMFFFVLLLPSTFCYVLLIFITLRFFFKIKILYQVCFHSISPPFFSFCLCFFFFFLFQVSFHRPFSLFHLHMLFHSFISFLSKCLFSIPVITFCYFVLLFLIKGSRNISLYYHIFMSDSSLSPTSIL